MSTRGQSETAKLQKNIEDQLDRLMQQLVDLEECRDELEEEEYNETRSETIDQLGEFQKSLEDMKSGNMTLVDDLNRYQLAIQAAISNAFQTPEVIKLFAKKQPAQLRIKLAEIERDAKIGKMTSSESSTKKLEILMALKKLGEYLTAEENNYIEKQSSNKMKEFEQVASDKVSESVLLMASSDISKRN
ncbi:DgyrCDS10249 [Dimorphilus gyrociliatus]|uniref:DgyrCDS10249 n=1 Tax=Dimorphilus gyrociliatus TaxID=2664684 RepID=A0A7I8W279_9ANNE|nr:DgyrCDS10249 [Dimorphilus gyrociliatus]